MNNALDTVAIAICSTALLTSSLPAQEDMVRSGPESGMALTKVGVYAPLGPYKGKEFDAASEIGKRPGALLFVKDLTRETAPLIRTLDQLGSKHSIHGFQAFTILLAGDRSSGEETVQRVSRSLTMRNPMCVSLDGAEGPGNYALHRNCTVTLVLVKDGAVVESIGFTDTGRKDIPRIEKAVEAITGKLPRTPEQWQAALPDDPAQLKRIIAGLVLDVDRANRQIERLQQNNQRQRKRRNMRGMRSGEAQRNNADRPKKKFTGKAPDDARLQSLIRKLIQKGNTAETIDQVFKDIDARVGQDPRLRQQILEGLKLILSLEYGNATARARARAYRTMHLGRKKDI